MARLLAPVALVALAGCFPGQPPSSFNSDGTDAGIEAGHVDGGAFPDGSFLGDGGGPTTFACGPTFCPSQTYCLITLSDGGAELQEDCYPPVMCDAGDCACIEGVVAGAYCPGGHVTCTAGAGVIATCAR